MKKKYYLSIYNETVTLFKCKLKSLEILLKSFFLWTFMTKSLYFFHKLLSSASIENIYKLDILCYLFSSRNLEASLLETLRSTKFLFNPALVSIIIAFRKHFLKKQKHFINQKKICAWPLFIYFNSVNSQLQTFIFQCENSSNTLKLSDMKQNACFRLKQGLI